MLEARPNWNVAHTARRVGEGGSDDEPIADDVSNRSSRDTGRVVRPLGSVTMAEVVLRVRLTGGDHIDVTYDEPDTVETDQIIEHVISTLAEDSGVLRSTHGDRLVALYGRGVAAIEIAPRGAIL
jgi:hypothetical protein